MRVVVIDVVCSCRCHGWPFVCCCSCHCRYCCCAVGCAALTTVVTAMTAERVSNNRQQQQPRSAFTRKHMCVSCRAYFLGLVGFHWSYVVRRMVSRMEPEPELIQMFDTEMLSMDEEMVTIGMDEWVDRFSHHNEEV